MNGENDPPTSDRQPHYITRPCIHCHKGIEFDLSQLDLGETRVVNCPHCFLATTIGLFLQPDTKAEASRQQVPKKEIPPVVGAKTRHGMQSSGRDPHIIHVLMTAALFVVGIGISMEGFMGYLSENLRSEISAIRLAHYAIQYTGGLIVIALSIALWLLIKILRAIQTSIRHRELTTIPRSD